MNYFSNQYIIDWKKVVKTIINPNNKQKHKQSVLRLIDIFSIKYPDKEMRLYLIDVTNKCFMALIYHKALKAELMRFMPDGLIIPPNYFLHTPPIC